MNDEQIMSDVIQLALKGKDFVSPNPRVGAVIVKDFEIIAEGWHKKYGGDHAEVDVIKNAAGIDLKGKTLYCNLEPCSHYGKTPPCVNAIIESGIAKVVIGMQDPNPEVSGKGIKILQDAGIEVIVGVLEDECKWLNRYFIHHIITKQPYVILKIGQSINGNIATSKGESKWITGEESRKMVHQIRSDVDAVLIGRNTAETDNPKLNVRNIIGHNPKRVIFDTKLSLPLALELYCDEDRFKTIVCCSTEAYNTRKSKNLQITGVKVIDISLNSKEKLDVAEAIEKLYTREKIGSLLVEGGARLFSSFLEAGIYNELHFFIAPMIIGNGINSFGFFETKKLNQTPIFKIKSFETCGNDIHIFAVKN